VALVGIEYPFDHVALIRLQDGKSNVLSKQLISELNAHIQICEESPHIRCMVLTGNEHVFSAGADLKELRDVQPETFPENDFITPWQRLSFFSKPSIVAASGYVLGGGFELALMGDIIIASETAVFGFPEVTLDLLPGGGGTQRLARRVGQGKALELCLTGNRLTAHEAFLAGIVNQVHSNYLQHGLEMAKKISTFGLHALQAIKKSIMEGGDLPLSAGMAMERNLFYHLLQVGSYKSKIETFFNK
jgi:enoyl-CoA hydratase/carnithine racemase